MIIQFVRINFPWQDFGTFFVVRNNGGNVASIIAQFEQRSPLTMRTNITIVTDFTSGPPKIEHLLYNRDRKVCFEVCLNKKMSPERANFYNFVKKLKINNADWLNGANCILMNGY